MPRLCFEYTQLVKHFTPCMFKGIPVEACGIQLFYTFWTQGILLVWLHLRADPSSQGFFRTAFVDTMQCPLCALNAQNSSYLCSHNIPSFHRGARWSLWNWVVVNDLKSRHSSFMTLFVRWPIFPELCFVHHFEIHYNAHCVLCMRMAGRKFHSMHVHGDPSWSLWHSFVVYYLKLMHSSCMTSFAWWPNVPGFFSCIICRYNAVPIVCFKCTELIIPLLLP